MRPPSTRKDTTETRKRPSTSAGSSSAGNARAALSRSVSQLASRRSRTRREACTGRKRTAEAEKPAVETAAAIERFLARQALSEATRRSYRVDLEQFAAWLARRGIELESFDSRAFAE